MGSCDKNLDDSEEIGVKVNDKGPYGERSLNSQFLIPDPKPQKPFHAFHFLSNKFLRVGEGFQFPQ